MVAWIPNSSFNQLPQTLGFVTIVRGDLWLARHLRDLRYCGGVSIHIAVDGRPVSRATDAVFHPIAIVDLPEETVSILVRGRPRRVVLLERRQQACGQPFI